MDFDIKLPKPHSGQQLVIQSKARWKVLLCGRRWGKSLICQLISILTTINKQHVAYVTPTYKLAKVFFQDIIQLLPKKLIRSANKTDLVITLYTGGSISFFSGESESTLNSFRGRKFHKVIIDEAAHINDLESAWNNSIRPTLSDYQGEAIFISTPRGKNFFYTLYLRGLNLEKNYESWHYDTYSNPFIQNSEIDEAKRTLPESVFQQEYLAIPNANSNSVVRLEHITNNTIDVLSSEPTVCFGIDVAKYSDYSVICGISETGSMTYFERFQTSNDFTEQRIKALPQNIMKVMDGTHGSIGDGIYERLIKDGVQNLTAFEFTAKSKPELITQMILDIEQGNLKFNKITADELSIFEYSYSSTGHIKYGNASGGHDDCVIALALANKFKKRIPTNFLNSFGWA
jgi:hypothetical protein